MTQDPSTPTTELSAAQPQPNPAASATTSEHEPGEARMPLWEHLDVLRKVLFRCLIAVLLGLCVTYSYAGPIVRFLEQPLLNALPAGYQHLYFTGIADKFFIYLKISLYAAIALTSPYLLYQFWTFISPALYKNERRFVVPFIFFATISFVVGLAFAYKLVIPGGYKFLINFGSADDRALITLTEYFSLTLQLMMAMGLVFELPVVLVLLAKFEIIKPEVLGKYRRQAYVVLSIVAAVVTPTPDALSMLMVLVPLWLLYELSVILVKWVAPKGNSM